MKNELCQEFQFPCKKYWYDIVYSANTWCFSKCSFQCPVGKWRKSSKGGQSMSIQNQGIQQLDLALIGVVVYLIGCLSHLKSKNNHLMRWCTHTCTCYSFLPGRSQSHDYTVNIYIAFIFHFTWSFQWSRWFPPINTLSPSRLKLEQHLKS